MGIVIRLMGVFRSHHIATRWHRGEMRISGGFRDLGTTNLIFQVHIGLLTLRRHVGVIVAITVGELGCQMVHLVGMWVYWFGYSRRFHIIRVSIHIRCWYSSRGSMSHITIHGT